MDVCIVYCIVFDDVLVLVVIYCSVDVLMLVCSIVSCVLVYVFVLWIFDEVFGE